MNKRFLLLLFLILAAASVLRLFRLTQNPPGLYWDEVAIGYNAYSVLKTGRDEWNQTFPVLFRSYNDYKLPLYIYSVIPFEKLLGPTDLAVRLPSAFAGTLVVLATFLFVRESAGPGNWGSVTGLLSAAFMAVSPWAIQFSRAAFEANLAMLFVCLGALCFLVFFRRSHWWLLFSMVFFAASVYTYQSEKVFVPAFIAVLFSVYRRRLFSDWKKLFLIGVVTVIVLMPFFATAFTFQGMARARSESVLNEPGELLTNLSQNYLANFSFDYLFFRGDQNGRHLVKKLGELYLWQLPLVLTGVYLLIKRRKNSNLIILSWLALAALPPAVSRVSPHALRGLLMVIPLQIVSVVGLVFWVKKLWPYRYISLPIFCVIAAYSLALYLSLYYRFFPHAYAADWQTGNKEAVSYLKKISPDYDRIFVASDLPPMYFLFYLPIDPNRIQQSGHDLTQIDRFTFFDSGKPVIPAAAGQRTLILAPWWNVSQDTKLIRQIKLPNGSPEYGIYEL